MRPPANSARPGLEFPRRVLCIEDDRETLDQLTEFVVRAGYETLTAESGVEGLSKIISARPDLVLCDVAMPCTLDFEMLGQLRASALGMSQIPFIFLTDCTNSESRLGERRLEFDDYVAKPIDFDILETAIHARLRQGPRSRLIAAQRRLSVKEIAALQWSARGKSSGEIAGIMGAPKRSVDFFLDGARRKLGAATRVQAVAMAVSLQIIEA